MKGTEKQIAWANDIIDNIKEIFKAAEEAQPNHPMIEQVKELHSKIIENMNNMYAGYIIDDFKNVERHIDKSKAMEDYENLTNKIIVAEYISKRSYRK